jgi:hypothetical protein
MYMKNWKLISSNYTITSPLDWEFETYLDRTRRDELTTDLFATSGMKSKGEGGPFLNSNQLGADLHSIQELPQFPKSIALYRSISTPD